MSRYVEYKRILQAKLHTALQEHRVDKDGKRNGVVQKSRVCQY